MMIDAPVVRRLHSWVFAAATPADTYTGEVLVYRIITYQLDNTLSYRSVTETRASSTGKWQGLFLREHREQG